MTQKTPKKGIVSNGTANRASKGFKLYCDFVCWAPAVPFVAVSIGFVVNKEVRLKHMAYKILCFSFLRKM